MSEELEFEARLARQQKRARAISIGVVALVVIGAVLAYVLWPKSEKPKCKADQVRTFLKEKSLPAGTVGGVCSFPSNMDQALRELAAVPPRMRQLVIFKFAAENPDLFMPVCKGYARAAASAAQESRDRATAIFLRTCDLSKTGIASKEDLASAPVHRLLLAMAVYTSLRKSDPRWAKVLAREVCCAGRP